MDDKNLLLDGKFKDESPVKTVERIIDIFRSNGIEVEEFWRDSGVPYCYAMSVKVKGGTIRSNGKGLSPEFARASGYAELMERMQMGFTGNADAQKDGDFLCDTSMYDTLCAQELIAKNRRWYQLYSDRLYQATGQRMSPEAIVMQYADARGFVSATPYYNAVTGEKDHLPTVLRKRIYTTTGCAAGNTMEEAIVQAISEIVERNHQMRVISEDLTLPDIPDEVLQKYTASYEIISYVRSQGFKVVVKDCSLGTRFPVACACFIDCKTGKYHTHFGAYPVFEIALQRSLTETFQIGSIKKMSTFEDFLFQKKGDGFLCNMLNELTKGTGQKTTNFFTGHPSFPFNENMGFSGSNNRELLRQCIAFFAEQGYDVLVRDRSSLGFPTCQVLIPGYSEPYTYRINRQLDEHRYSAYAYKALRNPSAAGVQDLLGLLMHVEEMRKFKANTPGYRGFAAGTKLALQLSAVQNDDLMNGSLGYAYYALGRHQEALQCINALICSPGAKDTEYLICLKRYLTLQLKGYSKERIREIIAYFHTSQTVNRLYACMELGGNPLEEFTLHCNNSCDDQCPLYSVCYQSYASELADMINKKARELDFDKFAGDLKELLA